METALSVIIPTRDRAALLTDVVARLRGQAAELAEPLEIVIVDDGSTEPVAESRFRGPSGGEPAAIRLLRQPPRGPAAARNLGIREARGSLVLFLGDDVLPSPGLLSRHLALHQRSGDSVAVLGIADLAPQLTRTPFTRWWRRWNFRYDLLMTGARMADYSFFYTNNLSLRRSFLITNGMFDEEFPSAAYEDSELGFRLVNRGLQIIFDPLAKAEHWHPMDLGSACRRMITRGASYDMFVAKTGMPGLSRLWHALGDGPWMGRRQLRPLYALADRLQTRAVVGALYIVVLMHFFQHGRGRLSLGRLEATRWLA